jgi:hypothetical protein
MVRLLHVPLLKMRSIAAQKLSAHIHENKLLEVWRFLTMVLYDV